MVVPALPRVMAPSVETLTDAGEAEYERFVLRSPRTLLYHGAGFRRLLRAVLEAEDRYLVARDTSGAIVGALPAFLRRGAGGHGAVLNSLPFFGSNGGLLEFEGSAAVRRALLDRFEALAREESCVSSTIVTSPLDEEDASRSDIAFDLRDERLGQVTTLPGPAADVGAALMDLFHVKSRNALRKAQKLALTVTREEEDALAFVAATHRQNILAKAGLAKEPRFFETLARVYERGRDYDVWVARHDGQPVAGLLVLYFNRTAEYYTPAVVEEYRSWQPLSLIVFEAMQAAVQHGLLWWNWGGTWASQEGVRRFKERLGAGDRPYHYFTRLFDPSLLHRRPEDLLREFPHFYVLPFSALRPEAP
jgi:CelD/BcsL family acetyltransferase involved in cellulose biosynthesis